MAVQKRNLLSVAVLLLVTLGFYFIYWTVKTKGEINKLGANIPTAWLMIIPIVHFYFWYKYAEGFTDTIKKNSEPVAYFLLMSLLPVIGIFIVQAELNKYTQVTQS